MTSLSRFLAALATAGLASCGVTIPTIEEPWDTEVRYPGASEAISATAQIEFQIYERIYCELREAVNYVQARPYTDDQGKSHLPLPLKWGAAVAISLEVDEATALNPGVSFNKVFENAIHQFGPATIPAHTVSTPQSFSLGFGATFSSTASRIDRFNPYYTIAELWKPLAEKSGCHPEYEEFHRHGVTPASSSPFILESDLGIRQWLRDATLVRDIVPSGVSGGGTPPISYEIRFVIVSGGNITPTWKLVKWSANTGTAPFFSTGRVRTHDLIITVGPNTPSTQNNHLASQIASGVASANKALLTGVSNPLGQ